MEILKDSINGYTSLALVAIFCLGMAFYEVRDIERAVVALASLLIKLAAIPFLFLVKVDLSIIAMVALLPISKLISYIQRKFDDRLDKNSSDSGSGCRC